MKQTALVLLIFCSITKYTLAQRKIEYGFNLGGGLGIQAIADPDITLDNSIRTFRANLVVYIPVLKKYYLQSGLSLSDKGTLVEEDALTTTNKIAYIELPVLFVRKFNLPTLGKLVAGLGGYAANGINGTITYETPSSNNFNYVAFGNNYDFKKYDGGLSALAGLELDNHLTFNLGYDLGLYNIAPKILIDAGTPSIYNREFTVTLGLIF